MLRHICQLLVVFTLFAGTGCTSTLRIDGPYEGKVIDAETNQPIEGAVVHATWFKAYFGGGSEYYGSYEILTDKKGEFKIPGQGVLILSNVAEMMPVIFKAGYSKLPGIFYWSGLRSRSPDLVSWEGGKVTIKLKRLTLEERRKRSVWGPVDVPNKDEKLCEREADREAIELGKGLKFLYDWHNMELLK